MDKQCIKLDFFRLKNIDNFMFKFFYCYLLFILKLNLKKEKETKRQKMFYCR